MVLRPHDLSLITPFGQHHFGVTPKHIVRLRPSQRAAAMTAVSIANRNPFPKQQCFPPPKHQIIPDQNELRRGSDCLWSCFYFRSFSRDDPDCRSYNNNASMFNSLQSSDNASDSHAPILVPLCALIVIVFIFFPPVSHQNTETLKDSCHPFKRIGATKILLSPLQSDLFLVLPVRRAKSCFITI